MDFTNIDLVRIASIVIALVIAIVGHEIAHGYVAYKFGDNTAKNLGRLSINPIKHIDPVGTVIVPLVLYLSTGMMFGWAKPVPVNTYTVVRNGGYKAAIYVSLAGILYNIILGIATLFVLKVLLNIETFEILLQFLYTLALLNLILAVFNLYPIPPLDGFHAVEYALRNFGFHALADKLDSISRYGFIILIIILISPLKETIFYPTRYIIQIATAFING
ncbi:site-2 protease family protein [Campylobacter concisus]|jgi:peptidase M50|uniref:site-2 protease family protein n=1 Tax=Campylobacter concisus TaxID=199 RepID=UPI003D23D1A5